MARALLLRFVLLGVVLGAVLMDIAYKITR
jgi:hypothetical protein